MYKEENLGLKTWLNPYIKYNTESVISTTKYGYHHSLQIDVRKIK